MSVEIGSYPKATCSTPIKNLPIPRTKHTKEDNSTHNPLTKITPLPEESANIIWEWASFMFASER
ncbi:MAG: hypothetical protein KIH10_17230, partial [Candidatus Freyarchaeota archaeon]|nr:hypothetical protein [Candidatus Jordarchaeia archaeon]